MAMSRCWRKYVVARLSQETRSAHNPETWLCQRPRALILPVPGSRMLSASLGAKAAAPAAAVPKGGLQES